MDEKNMTKGQELGNAFYENARMIVRKENAEEFLLAIISAGKVLGAHCPGDAAEISILVGAAMHGLTHHIPANKMIRMLDPEKFNEMAFKFLECKAKHARKDDSNEAG